MPSIVLPDTSLCAIVRDEMMNPAGGIVDFVESTAPFVKEAVILDTGSVDGTYKTLMDLRRRFPNLKVFQHPFEGYAQSRNRSLTHVRTKRALVLDADERIKARDFGKIKDFLEQKRDIDGYGIMVTSISYLSGLEDHLDTHNPRLFTTKDTNFSNSLWRGEQPNILAQEFIPDVSIYHFLPSIDIKELKEAEWYKEGDKIVAKRGIAALPSPSECPSFAKWKTLNPHRGGIDNVL
ncbi:glycosyltransferase [Candidatus Pacearchaeota archaeon]|nr:glycosyltransferase [Candidatus Pacearchaeota archaeon]